MAIFFRGAAACAIEERIYLFSEEKKISAELLRHECVHVQHYRELGGFVLFLALYFGFTLHDLIVSKGQGALAYKWNPFEEEARLHEKKDKFRARTEFE